MDSTKGEPTTEIVSNWVKTPEDEDELDEAARVKKKNVKLTRKSPYVVGPYASTAILKGKGKLMAKFKDHSRLSKNLIKSQSL